MRTLGVVILTLTLTITASAADWGVQALQVWHSIAYLQIVLEDGTEGNCTAFSINEKQSLYMTAAHCYGETMKLDLKVPAVVVYYNDAEDLMMLQAVTPYRKPALHPAKRPYLGEEVASLGYGMGYGKPMLRAGIVSLLDLDSASFGHRLYNLYDFSFVNGMSGGPVFDLEGRVVGIVNASYRDGTMGAGRPLAALRAAWPEWR